MKKLIVFMFVCIFLISFVSAFEIDNVKDYDEVKKEITITNAFGLGDDIAKITLNTPQVYRVIPGEDRLVAEFTINNLDGDYSNAFKQMDFYNINSGNSKFTRDFTYKKKVFDKNIIKPIYENVCEVSKTNGSDICTRTYIGDQTIPTYKWVDLTVELTILSKGNITIGIFTDVLPGDRVEWIPTLFGVEINEWAVWTASLNVGLGLYYTLQENSGDAVERVFGIYNGTNINSVDQNVNGIIGFGAGFDGSNVFNVSDNFAADLAGGENFTLNIWLNGTDIVTGATKQIINKRISGNNGWAFDVTTSSLPRFFFWQSDTTAKSLSGTAINEDTWYMITFVGNGVNVTMFQDGVFDDSTDYDGTVGNNAERLQIGGSVGEGQFFIGVLDEIGIWNRSLSATEVTDLYNGGAGISFQDPPPPLLNVTTELVAPTTGLSTLNTTLNFEANFTTIQGNLTNTTLIVSNPDGSTFQTNFTTIDGIFNVTSFDVSGLTFGTNYNWNYFTCVANSSTSFCDTAQSNNTFSVVGFTIISQTFNGSVNETSRQDFGLNISTITSILSVNANLNYNGTTFIGDVACDTPSNSCLINKDIDIPLVEGTAESENKTFFWEITTFDGTSSTIVNTSIVGQNVSRIHLEQCGGAFTSSTLNFTSANERNFTRINPFSFEATFDAWLGGGDVKRTTTFSSPSVAEMNLCLDPSTETFVDAIIEYNDVSNVTYTTRNYFFQNSTISSVPQNITLFLLESGEATTFILKVQDQNLLPVPNVLITIQRFRPGNNTFDTVQIARTDDNGATVGFFETEVVDYRFIISQNNNTLLITTAQKIVGETVPFTLIFTIGVVTTSPWDNFGNVTNLTSTLIFNRTSEIVTFTYEDISDIFEQGRLLVELNNPSNTTNSVICNVTSAQSSAILTCDVSSGLNASYIAQGFITRSGNESPVNVLLFVINVFAGIAGNLGLLLGWIMMLVASFTFKFNEIAGVWMVTITAFFVNMFGLISFGMLAIMAMIAIAIIITVQFGR